MPKPGNNEVLTSAQFRTFIQWGGPSPINPVRFNGKDAQYMEVDSITYPVRGNITPIRVHNPDQLFAYRNVGQTQAAPDLPTSKITFMHKHGGLSRANLNLTCPFNVYMPAGACRSLTDFVGGWTDKVGIISYASATKRTITGNAAFEKDEGHQTEVDITLTDYYEVGPMGFTTVANSEIEREVIAVVTASSVQCGECGVTDDGGQRVYTLCKSSGAGSPGTPAEIIFTNTAYSTPASQINITGLGGTVDPIAMAMAGRYLIVVSPSDNGYYFAEVNQLTGVPGLFTFVSAGFVAAKQPLDIYVASAREVFFVGNGGYIYRSTDITTGVTVIDAGSATTNNLVRITGNDECLVAVGTAGTILKSLNRGATWTPVTLSPTSATVRAIAVIDEYAYWIGTSGGLIYFTIDGGETWTVKTLATFSVIDDIIAPTPECLWIAARTATPAARLFNTWNGGADWAQSGTGSSRILNFPSMQYINRLASPAVKDAGVVSNAVWAGGLSSGGTDGTLAYGYANRL